MIPIKHGDNNINNTNSGKEKHNTNDNNIKSNNNSDKNCDNRSLQLLIAITIIIILIILTVVKSYNEKTNSKHDKLHYTGPRADAERSCIMAGIVEAVSLEQNRSRNIGVGARSHDAAYVTGIKPPGTVSILKQ